MPYNRTEVKRIVQRMTSLPTLPVILHNIVQCIDDPESSAADLQEIISNDPSISSRILFVANSAAYRRSAEITDIQHAVVALGFDTVLDLALCVSFARFFSSARGSGSFDRGQFWMHCMGAGMAARTLARLSRYDNPDLAFLLGLVHDVGKVALDHLFLDEFEQAVVRSRAEDRDLCACEHDIIGVTHTDVGAWLAGRWQFPQGIAAGIEYHHNLDFSPPEFQSEVFLTFLADAVVRQHGFGASGNGAVPAVPAVVLRGLELSEGDIKKTLEALEGHRAQAEQFLGLGV